MRTALCVVVVIATMVMIGMPGLRSIPASPRDPGCLRSGGFGNSAGLNDGLSCLIGVGMICPDDHHTVLESFKGRFADGPLSVSLRHGPDAWGASDVAQPCRFL
jgi:hypothetical protein